jgi:TolB-like protein/ribosomal protein L12E/L44/L45/RPP1/RPP2
MAAELVNMTRTASNSTGPMLALLPVVFTDSANKEEGDTLAQLLAIYLLRDGKYTIYPRTKNLEQVQSEYETQLRSGLTRADQAVRAGEAENPPYALSVISRNIGTGTRFNASIINLEQGSTILGTSEQYIDMSNGMGAMELIAKTLSEEEIIDQSRGSLGKIAILPFSGGTTDEQEGIAEILSFTDEMTNNFAVIPRTTITQAAEDEQSFQNLSGMTDPETSAKLGKQLGADYVMAGSITALGSQKLLIVSIVKIDVIRQVAGVYITYDSMNDFNRDKTLLENMAAELVNMTRTAGDSTGLMLALLPVVFTDSANKEEGDTLAQLLAIYLLRGGTYDVYPRTKNLESVQQEYRQQGESGLTRPDEAVTVGEAVNPPYVLSVISRNIGTGTRFNASIINLERGTEFRGVTEQYTSMSDGMWAMAFLAKKLSGEEITEAEREARALPAQLAQEAQEAEAAQKAQEAEFARKAQETARKAQERETFLKESGIVFGGRVGGGGGGREKVDEKGKVVEDEEGRPVWQSTSFQGGDIQFRWRFLGIQTGILVGTDYAPLPGEAEQYVELRMVQIPLLFCLNFMLKTKDSLIMKGFGITGFAGLNLNVAASSPDADSINDWVSFTAGVEVVWAIFSEYLEVFGGYQFISGKGSLTLNGASYDYNRSSHNFLLGARLCIPLRRK